MPYKIQPNLSLTQNLLLHAIAETGDGWPDAIGIPQLSAGGCQALSTAEAHDIGNARRLLRLAEEDTGRDGLCEPDIQCGISHLSEARAILARFR